MRTSRRRGANAIEFALIAPMLLVMLAGTLDYGWYFWREAMLVNGLREAVRAGGMQSAGTDEQTGACANCVAVAQTLVTQTLKDQGYGGAALTPKFERVPATGTPCAYAVTLSGKLDHARLFTLVPGPNQMNISLASMAQNLTCE